MAAPLVRSSVDAITKGAGFHMSGTLPEPPAREA